MVMLQHPRFSDALKVGVVHSRGGELRGDGVPSFCSGCSSLGVDAPSCEAAHVDVSSEDVLPT